MASAGNSTLSRASLGQVASLGDLYDARTDTFCGTSIFKRKLPDEAVTMTDNHFSDVHLITKDTFSEKFSKLDVKAELQVSVLAGLFTLQGSGRYLSDQKTSAKSVKTSLLYNVKTMNESVNIYHEDLKTAFAIDAIESGEATHVVVGISWGANSILTCEHRNSENRDIKEIEASLTAQLRKLSLSISGSASVNFNEGETNNNPDVDIRIFGDIIPQNQELPTTFEETLNLMRQMPQLVAAANGGKGKPLTYQLIPLSLLKGYLNFSLKADSMIRSLEEASLYRVVEVFEQITNLTQEINDFVAEANENQTCISGDDLMKINEMKNDLSTMEAQFRSKLAQVLVDVRSGKAEVIELEKLIMESQSDTTLSPKQLNEQLKSWALVKAKISFAKSLSPKGKYIGYGVSLDDEIIKNFDSKTYILYFKEDAKTKEPETWRLNLELFLQALKKGKPDCKYFAVDCNIQDKLWPAQGISIQVYHKGKRLTENLLEDQRKAESTAFAQSTLPMLQLPNKPNKRVNLTIPCGGAECSPTVDHTWMCPKCKLHIEYGFDTFFYCGCGRAPAISYEFKCPDQLHGVAFAKHEDTHLTNLLSRLRPSKEVNILIMGKTGVGKSTWINGFINFLNFKTLAEAEEHEDLITLVPTRFTISDADYNEIEVSTGTDQNENQQTGHSATQTSKVYSFPIGDTLIRLIDTPGIGDSRGVAQDKVNFQNILSTISYLDNIHGICIFMKPNDSRLTVMFRFCVNELLTYLHRDASRNIIFCFTNSRGTFYRPGDTLPALKKLLKDNKLVEIPVSKPTVYCYDSESFRFLAAVKNKLHPVEFSDEDRADYAVSWEKSRVETKRMLDHIKNLKPHDIQHTLKLNHARDIVVKLTRPLAEISKIIQINKDLMKDHLAEITLTNETIKDLQAKSSYSVQELEIIRLPYPKTVCTDESCKEYFGPAKAVKYTSICHGHCYLEGIAHDTIGDEGLISCWAMKPDGHCRHDTCGHHYRQHMHIYYDTEEVTKQVDDEAIKKLINSNVSAKEVKRKMIEAEELKIKENDEELKLIQQASVKFACFLYHNSITPYNDAMIAYLDHLINEEQGKVHQGKDRKTLDSLMNYRAEYEIEIDILKREITQGKNASDVLSPSAVEDTVGKLYSLKHNGKNLQDALANINYHKRESRVVYREVPAPPKKRTYRFYDPRGWFY